jgi:hypothetical protein
MPKPLISRPNTSASVGAIEVSRAIPTTMRYQAQ